MWNMTPEHSGWRISFRLAVGAIAFLTFGVQLNVRADAVMIGDALLDRPITDTASGSIFVLPEPTFSGPLSAFSFFSNSGSTADSITPVIVEQTSATTYKITGWGQTRVTSNSASPQGPFPFSLQAGSAALGPNRFLAWKDGSSTANNTGVPDWDNNGVDLIRWLGPTHTTLGINDVKTVSNDLGRSYSIQYESASNGAVIGDSTIRRGNSDGANGSIFILPDALPVGRQLAEWSMFDVEAGGGSVTPILFELVGGQYIVRGIGATHIGDRPGGQSFPFGLASGTDIVGPNYFLGWKDGAVAADNTGVVDFDFNDNDTVLYFGTHSSFGIGDNIGGGQSLGRSYSIQGLYVVPEPSTLMATLCLGLPALLRRHSASRKRVK